MNDYGNKQTNLIDAHVVLEFTEYYWAIRVYDADYTYTNLFYDRFPLPTDLGKTLVEFLEKYYVKECVCDECKEKLNEEDKDCE